MDNNFERKRTEQTTEEVEDMVNGVRKASELKSLDELNLSRRTYNCVKDISPESLVLLVRSGVYHIDRMWKASYEELDRAIEEAGFIRRDFDGRSFGLVRLYRAVADNDKTYWPYARPSDFESNEAYENFENFSEAQFEAVNQLLDDTLKEKEKDILQLLFGLVDGKSRYLEEVGTKYNCSRERVRSIEIKAIRKLKHKPRVVRLKTIMLFSSEKECRDQITSMEQQLSELRRAERELEGKIFAIREYSPFIPEEC